MDEIINYNFRLGFFDKPFFRLKPSSDTLGKMQSDREFSYLLHFTQALQGAYPTYCILLSALHRSEQALIHLQPKGRKLQKFSNLR